MYELIPFGGVVGVNYGYETVRFPAAVRSGSRLRMTATLAAAEDLPGGVQLTIVRRFECEGVEKPICVAESLVLVQA